MVVCLCGWGNSNVGVVLCVSGCGSSIWYLVMVCVIGVVVV